ncbi:MAG TPA: lipocalin family protein [Vicinamibacterales bacterium]|nr:lipocalin family protein [Vicinamibacterales bacterium]
MWPSVVFALSLAAAPQSNPVQPVDSVDLDRYVGRWHEIARYPNRFQRQCAGDVSATYGRREDGRIRVVNRCRTADGMDEAEGVARVVEGSGNARLKVRFAPAWLGFLPFVWGDYWVIGLAEDYRWAVVGTPDRKYLWILARDQAMPEDDWNAALERARENEFDVGRLQRTPQ